MKCFACELNVDRKDMLLDISANQMICRRCNRDMEMLESHKHKRIYSNIKCPRCPNIGRAPEATDLMVMIQKAVFGSKAINSDISDKELEKDFTFRCRGDKATTVWICNKCNKSGMKMMRMGEPIPMSEEEVEQLKRKFENKNPGEQF